MRIDAHTHIVPDDYRRALEQRGLLTLPLPPWSAGEMYALMDRHAIDASVVSLSPPGVWFGDGPLAVDLARLVNEQTAALVRSDPSRFAGLAVLPLPDTDAAIAELDHALDVLELDGVALLSNVGGIYHGDERFAPVWDALDARGAYVFLHPAAPTAPPALAQHPVWLYEFVFDTTRAVVNLIYSGTLERCRQIRLQVAHLGGTAPFLAHRIASLADREPERAGLAPSGALALLARLWCDTGLSNYRTAVEAAASIVPASQIVFGTDWPYAALPDTGDPAPELSYLGAQRAAVDAGNASRLVPRLLR